MHRLCRQLVIINLNDSLKRIKVLESFKIYLDGHVEEDLHAMDPL
jgi:hypothetical protein